MRRAFAVLFASLPLAASSCNGCGGTQEEACVKLATSLCAFTQRCKPFVLEFKYGDLSSCTTLEQDLLCSTLDLTDVVVTGGDLSDCAGKLDAAACGQTEDVICPAVYQRPGDKKGQASCFSNFQCQSLQCVQTDPTTCGVCNDLAGEGQPCSGTVACDPNHYCAGTCEPRLPLGSPCTDSAACSQGLFCLDGACGPPLQAGDDCAGNEAACDVSKGLLCVLIQSNSVCTLPTISKLGEPCGLTSTYVRFCSAELYCTLDETCAQRAAEGETCLSTDQCMPSLACKDGVCAVPAPAPTCQ